MASQTAIGSYVLRDEQSALDEYAASLGLSRSKLLGMLIIRELSCRRISSLAPRFLRNLSKKDGVWVAAQFDGDQIGKSFEDYVQRAALLKTAAAGAVFRAELEERWLEGLLSSDGNRI